MSEVPLHRDRRAVGGATASGASAAKGHGFSRVSASLRASPTLGIKNSMSLKYEPASELLHISTPHFASQQERTRCGGAYR